MGDYIERFAQFFFQSLQTLKRESGGQRWNEICEDTVSLYFHDCQRKNLTSPYPYSEMWQMFFDPVYFYEKWDSLLIQSSFHTTLFLCLHALLDPPAEWWQAQFR